MPTLEEVKAQIGSLDAGARMLARGEIKELPKILWEDECVEKLVQGTYGDGISNGILVATNKRAIFIDKGLMKLRVEDFPYDKISTVQYETGMMMGTVSIFTSGNRADIKNVEKKSCRAFADYLRARITAPTDHASAPSTPEPAWTPDRQPAAASDPLERLERLAALHDSGKLTDDEFATQKQRILLEF